MVPESKTIHGSVCWSEFLTRDVHSAMQFLQAVCGWTFQELAVDVGSYHVASLHGMPIAGVMDINTPSFDGVPAHWLSYIAVDNVDAAVELARKAGGTVRQAPFSVPSVGRIAVVVDQNGGAIGLMTPAQAAG